MIDMDMSRQDVNDAFSPAISSEYIDQVFDAYEAAHTADPTLRQRVVLMAVYARNAGNLEREAAMNDVIRWIDANTPDPAA